METLKVILSVLIMCAPAILVFAITTYEFICLRKAEKIIHNLKVRESAEFKCSEFNAGVIARAIFSKKGGGYYCTIDTLFSEGVIRVTRNSKALKEE